MYKVFMKKSMNVSAMKRVCLITLNYSIKNIIYIKNVYFFFLAYNKFHFFFRYKKYYKRILITLMEEYNTTSRQLVLRTFLRIDFILTILIN